MQLLTHFCVKKIKSTWKQKEEFPTLAGFTALFFTQLQTKLVQISE